MIEALRSHFAGEFDSHDSSGRAQEVTVEREEAEEGWLYKYVVRAKLVEAASEEKKRQG